MKKGRVRGKENIRGEGKKRSRGERRKIHEA